MVRPNLRSIFDGAPQASPRDPGARWSPAAPGPRAPTVRRRRSTSTALLHGYDVRSQTPVSTASTFYPGYARSWSRRPPRGPCTPRSGEARRLRRHFWLQWITHVANHLPDPNPSRFGTWNTGIDHLRRGAAAGKSFPATRAAAVDPFHLNRSICFGRIRLDHGPIISEPPDRDPAADILGYRFSLV